MYKALQSNWVFATILNFLIFKSVQTDFLSFKYLRSSTLGCKEIVFSKLEYMAKCHFPCKCEMVDVGKNHIFKALFVSLPPTYQT